MVEIALALAVLAIGISSILVLFPVGINANRSAIADNNLADISEFLMGYLRAGCVAEWTKIAEDKAAGTTTTSYFFSDKIPSGRTNLSTSGDTAGIDPEDTAYNSSSSKLITDNLYRILDSSDSKSNSIFLYKQTSGNIVDFAGVVKVWRDNATTDPSYFYIRNAADEDKVDKIETTTLRPYAMVLNVEISWPAQAPYAQREKRVFRQEIFNEAYTY